jgi:hypothetical protein
MGETCFEIHHILEWAEGGSDDRENLIVLCPNCHQHRVHQSKEITRDQLRIYKRRLGNGGEIEKRLLLNAAAVRARVSEVLEAEETPRPSPAISAILIEMIGSRDPCAVFQVDIPGWRPSSDIQDQPTISGVYARVFALESPASECVVVLIERLSEDISQLGSETPRRTTAGTLSLDHEEVELVSVAGSPSGCHRHSTSHTGAV